MSEVARAAWGSLIGLGVSSSFVSHSALATSDMFFLALYYSCFFFVLQAIRTKSNKLWGVAGGVLGLALLTRSSSLPLLVLFVFPWIQFLPLHTRFKNFRWFLIGLLLPLLVWGSIATLTSSPLAPTHSHYNVAVTYFSEGGNRFAGEAEWQFLGKFDNILEVFAYDPVKIGIIYAKDFYYMLKQNFARNAVVAFPLNLFAFPGLLLLFFRSRRPSDFLRSFQFLFLVAVLMQIALMNLVAWQPRHFLFLVPIFGAGAGLCFKNILEAIRFRSLQCAMLLVLLPFIIVGIRDSVGTTHKKLHSEDQELGEAVPEIKNWLTPNSFVVVRRPHIPFYTQSQQVFFPMVDTLGDLRATLQAEWKGEPIYLYYGRDEQSRRPQFKELKSPENSPAWLEPVTKSKTPGLWVLYRFKPNLNCKEMEAVRGK